METKHRNNMTEIDKDKFRFDVDVYIFKEEEHMAAYCPSLDLATTGIDFQDSRAKSFYLCWNRYNSKITKTNKGAPDWMLPFFHFALREHAVSKTLPLGRGLY